MIQRIVKTELNSLIVSSKVPSNQMFVNELVSFLEWGWGRNLCENYKTDE
jgi:hypothetical protein